MLKTYKYVATDHSKLHEFIVSFFSKIEKENGDFKLDFFDPEFQPIVAAHPRLIKNRCRAIYEKFKKLDDGRRADFCKRLVESNEIDKICSGEIEPLRIDNIPDEIRDDVSTLFEDLYEKTLKQKESAFRKQYGSLVDHFRQLKSQNRDIVICPACGLNPVSTEFDAERDDYDHYLPKSIYPLSSVNFKNLVPVCTKCNSKDVKSNIDIIRDTTGKVFYPFDEHHKGISVEAKIIKNTASLSDIDWDLVFSNDDGGADKVKSWKTIYKIEERYKRSIKGRVNTWHSAFQSFRQNPKLASKPLSELADSYLASLEARSEAGLDVLEVAVVGALITSHITQKALTEARAYS